MWKLVRSLLAPLGALLQAAAVVLPCFVMEFVALSLEQQSEAVQPLLLLSYLGVIGALLLSIGMIGNVRTPFQPGPGTFALCFAAGILMLLGAMMSGYGNSVLLLAFASLASSQQVVVADFREAISGGWKPLISGGVSFVAGSILLSVAAFRAKPGKPVFPIPVIPAAAGGIVVCIAGARAVLAARWIDGAVGSPASPAQLAEQIMIIMTSTYATFFAWTAFALTALLACLRRKPQKTWRDSVDDD